tara:strand:+ start:341 stop:508 length:168 start_codon:yes stop_codon:yes gene_type:complete
MELDTTIMQTRTVKTICEVLIEVQDELVIPANKNKVHDILARWDAAVALGSTYKE